MINLVAEAFSRNNYNFWWIAIGLGFVVVLVVIVLLSLLVSFVRDIEEESVGVLERAGQVADNTTKLADLNTTAVAAQALEAEVKKHVALLSKL